MNEEYLFETALHLRDRAAHTRKASDITAYMDKQQEIRDKGLEDRFAEWYIEQQEERNKQWNIQRSLEELRLR